MLILKFLLGSLETSTDISLRGWDLLLPEKGQVGHPE